MRRITLLTDFGYRDGYVGAMKGVVASIAPDAVVDDVAHDLTQGDVPAAAWELHRYWRLYPEGTVHVVVVDPGVGSGRRALAAEVDGRFLVGPDNGVFSHVLREAETARVVALTRTDFFLPRVSRTFHGRDVFAPVGAHLARGVDLDALGPPVENPTRLVWPEPTRDGGSIHGEVVHVDRFGNLVTNVPGDWVPATSLVWVGDRVAGSALRTYADVDPGELLALVGSVDLLEVSVRDGSAADMLEARRGTPVRVELGGTGPSRPAAS